MKTKKATEKRLALGEIPRWKLQLYLQEKGETSVYRASKELRWTPGKTHAIVRTLEKANVIKSSLSQNAGRTQKIIHLVQ